MPLKAILLVLLLNQKGGAWPAWMFSWLRKKPLLMQINWRSVGPLVVKRKLCCSSWIGKANAIAGSIWGFSSYLDSISKTVDAKHIKKLLKKHKGVYLQSIQANFFEPGGNHIGGWNGTMKSAKKLHEVDNSQSRRLFIKSSRVSFRWREVQWLLSMRIKSVWHSKIVDLMNDCVEKMINHLAF